MTTLTRTKADGGAWVTTVDTGGGGGSLPSWWDVVSTPGSESVIFNGYLQSSGPGPLLAEFYDAGGDYGLDVYKKGLDVIGDGTGNILGLRDGSGDPLVVVGPTGAAAITPSDPDVTPFKITPPVGFDTGNYILERFRTVEDDADVWIVYYDGEFVSLSPAGQAGAGGQIRGDPQGVASPGSIALSPGHAGSNAMISLTAPAGKAALFAITTGADTESAVRIARLGENDPFFEIGPTGAVAITPSDPAVVPLTLGGLGQIDFPAFGAIVGTAAGPGNMSISDASTYRSDGDGIYWSYSGVEGEGEASFYIGGEYVIRANAGKLGFFGAASATKPTGVAVSAPGIHAALVTLGLIAA